MKFTRNTPLKICLLLRDQGIPGINVRVGEYICLAPSQADGYGRVGTVKVISDVLKSDDIRKAGGWRKMLEKQPKLRVCDESEEASLWKQLENIAPKQAIVEKEEQESSKGK